jgi:parallel beta-helix repeat protein
MAIFVVLVVLTGCGSSPSASGPDELDLAIRDASDYLNDNIPEGSMIVILNMQSDSAALSEYIIDELIANAVNDRIFKVVDRQQLDLIRTEQNFQLSGEVDDNLALSIGKFLGAHTIVSGRITQLGDRYRMSIRGLDVQTAQVQGQYNRNIAAGKTINDLMRSGGGSGRLTQSTTGRTTGSGNSGSTISSGTGQALQQTAPIEPPITGTAVPGTSLTEKLAWLQRSADSHNTYILEINANENIAPHTFEFRGAINITVVLRGDDENRIVRLRSNGTMFTVKPDVTLILDNNITLMGHNGNNGSMVYVDGGTFKMRTGSAITNNNKTNGSGSGVSLREGTFDMTGGTISGNSASGNGGGVMLSNPMGRVTFNMSGGTITNNIASDGGGVCQSYGTFKIIGGTIANNTATRNGGGIWIQGGATMSGGIITNNTATEYGGGVYGYNGASFTKTGGIITGYNSDSDNGNKVADSAGNVFARKGHAVCINQWGSSAILRKETTVGPSENLSFDNGKVTGTWDN